MFGTLILLELSFVGVVMLLVVGFVELGLC